MSYARGWGPKGRTISCCRSLPTGAARAAPAAHTLPKNGDHEAGPRLALARRAARRRLCLRRFRCVLRRRRPARLPAQGVWPRRGAARTHRRALGRVHVLRATAQLRDSQPLDDDGLFCRFARPARRLPSLRALTPHELVPPLRLYACNGLECRDDVRGICGGWTRADCARGASLRPIASTQPPPSPLFPSSLPPRALPPPATDPPLSATTPTPSRHGLQPRRSPSPPA